MSVPRRIGSTDIAAICALYNPALAADLPKNKTAADVFNRLRWGLESPRTKRMDRGNVMEPYALDYYGEHVGPWWRAEPLGEWWTIADPRNPDFTASPDAWNAPRPRIVVESKTWSEKWGRGQWGAPGTDQMATRFLYQCQWLMARSDAEQAHVVVLFGNDVPTEHGDDVFVVTEPAVYCVARDAKFEAHLNGYGLRFLEEFVLPGIPPPVKSAHHRREMKWRLENERGTDAVDEWKQRCAEHAATNGTDELGRPVSAQGAGDEARGGDGLR